MKKIIIAVICVIVAALVACVLIFLNLPKITSVAVTSLHINSSTIRLESDMMKKLSITVHPEEADKSGYKLVSENEFVAVCNNDNVAAVNEGETFVYAESSDGKVQSNKVKVIVNNDIFEVAAKVILSAEDAQYFSKETAQEVEQIKEEIKPEEGTDEEVIEEAELTPEDASQIAETEIETVPETYQLPVVTEQNAGEVVYITRSGDKFHLSTCSYAKEATAITRSQAVADGKTPCKKCKP